MLSSVANRIYWCGRYLERAENTARLINVYTQLLLDLPSEAGISLHQLVKVVGAESNFQDAELHATELDAVHFLINGRRNPSSLTKSISNARENLRTLREIVPSESFQALNKLLIYSQRRLTEKVPSRIRFDSLKRVIQDCQQLVGLFEANMSHGDAYQFLRLGYVLERADMTTRIVDVAGELLNEGDNSTITENQTMLWVNVLRSLSAYQAYRQSVKSRIAPVRVLHFIVNDEQFPRALMCCLSEIEQALSAIPRSEDVKLVVKETRQVVQQVGIRNLASSELHQYMDQFQVALGNIHNAIDATWFQFDQSQLERHESASL